MDFDLTCERYMKWAPHVTAVGYNNGLILLKEKQDEFLFLDDAQSDFVRTVWSKKLSELEALEREGVSELISTGLIALDTEPSVTELVSDEKKSKGVYEPRWSVSEIDAEISSFRVEYFIKALWSLRVAKSRGGKRELSWILRKLKSKSPAITACNDKELLVIAKNTNLAMKFMLRKVQCLEFAYAISRIGFDKGLYCKFRIGIQTHPFISHAWVEGSEGVVMDRNSLPEELAIIVSIGGGNEVG